MERNAERERPDSVSSITVKRRCGCGSLYTVISYDDEGALEVFAYLGKSGACARSQIEGITRCISQGLRFGVPMGYYIDQLKGVRCEKALPSSGSGVGSYSCSDALSRCLEVFQEIIWPSIVRDREAKNAE